MNSVPVLLYHHVAPDREITPEGFERQLEWLVENRFRTLSSEELYAHVTGARPAPDRSVVLTFDDGYAGNWVYAHPSLKKYGMKAVLFVVTDRLGAGPVRPTSEVGGRIPDTVSEERGTDAFLRWSELKAMCDSGVFEAGSHTRTHKGFVEEAEYEDLEDELKGSKEKIEAELGRWSGMLAWPWGVYRAEWLSLLRPAGYRMAFTTQVGPNRPGTDPLRIERFKVQKEDLGWLRSRLWLYRQAPLAWLYGRLYGLDRRLKAALARNPAP